MEKSKSVHGDSGSDIGTKRQFDILEAIQKDDQKWQQVAGQFDQMAEAQIENLKNLSKPSEPRTT